MESSKRIAVFSFAVWCLLVVLSSSTIPYAAEGKPGAPGTPGAQGIQGQQSQKSLPAMIKANPSMISAPKYINLPPEFNTAVSGFDNNCKSLQQTFAPALSEAYGKWAKKWDECVNKAYNYDDQKSAGCLPNDSVDKCIGKLVSRCIDGESWKFAISYNALDGTISNLKYNQDAMKSGLKKLHDYVLCLRTQWPQQTCQ